MQEKITTLVILLPPEPIYHNGMNRLRSIRTAKKLSQQKLADLVGTSAPQINRLEKSRRKLTVEWLERIAPHLGCEPYELVWNMHDEVPLVSWVQAGSMTETADPYLPGDPEAPKFKATGIPHELCIALKVQGESMNRIAPNGSVIIVDLKKRDLLPGRYYVVRDNDEATFKKYESDPVPLLVPDSTGDFPKIAPGPGHEVVGRVIKVVMDLD